MILFNEVSSIFCFLILPIALNLIGLIVIIQKPLRLYGIIAIALFIGFASCSIGIYLNGMIAYYIISIIFCYFTTLTIASRRIIDMEETI